MYEDNRLSVRSLKEFRVTVCFVLEEVKEVVFKFFLMMRRNGIIFSCPTNDTGRCLTENSEGCKASVRVGE